jgi:rare lipoprotein A
MSRRVEFQLCSVYVMRIATRFRRAPDCSWALWALLWGVLVANPIVAVPVSAKIPGGLHCYRLVCHRVMTLTETHRLVGSTRTMIASYYDDPRFDRYNTGQLTSSGERFDASDPGRAASSVFPDGTELLLWNASNGRAAHVRVNDFGPFLGNRTLDITKSLAERLDITRKGVVALRVTVIASPSTNQSQYRRFRVYPTVAGYLGVYSEPGLITLAKDLMSDSRSPDAQPSSAGRVAHIPLPHRKPLHAPSTRNGLLTPPLPQIRIAAPQTLRPQPPMENATLLSPPLLRASETLPTDVVMALASDSDRPAIYRLIHPQNRNALAALVVVLLLGATIILIQRSSRARMPSHLRRPVASPALQTKPSAVSVEGSPAVAHFIPQTPSFIGRELQVSGDLVTYNDLVLEGRIDGDCVCRRLTIKVGGILNGDVVAEEVLIAGSVTGKILAKIVGIDSRAAISGEINYCDLIVERNRFFDVTCHRISIEAWRKPENLEPPSGPPVVQSSSSSSDSKTAFHDGGLTAHGSQQTLRGSLHEVRF